MAAQYIPIKRISSLDAPIRAEKLDGSLFTTENQAHEFIVSVRKNGVKQTVTGSVSGKFIRANGTTIFLQGSIVDGDAVVRLHQDCYNVQGRFTFNIFNTQSGVTTCIYSAVGKMDMGSTETVIDAGDVVPDVSDVVAAQEAAQAAITAANTAAQTANTAAQNVGSIVARPYSSSSTYTAGDYCTNNGNLYKANQDISTAEEWTASHWTQIVMGDEVTSLKSALRYNIIATNDIVSFEHNETTTAGSHIFQFPYIIYNGTTFNIANNGGNSLTINLRDENGNEQNFPNIPANSNADIVAPFDVVAMRNYIGGTDWKFTVTFCLPIRKALDSAIADFDARCDVIEQSIENIEKDVASITDGESIVVEYSQATTGSTTVTLPRMIKKGTIITIKNEGTGSFSINLRNATGTEQGFGISLGKGETCFMRTFDDIVSVRSYVSAGVDVKMVIVIDPAIKNDDFDLSVLSGNNLFPSNMFEIGGLTSGIYKDSTIVSNRLATPKLHKIPFDITIVPLSGFRFGVQTFSDNIVFEGDTGFLTAQATIPANKYFLIGLAKNPDESFSDKSEILEGFVVFAKSTSEMNYEYDTDGGFFTIKKNKYGVKESSITRLPDSKPQQGIGYCNGMLFQSYSDNDVRKIGIIDLASNSIIATLSASGLGHGNNIAFTDIYDEEEDEFPLALVSDTTDPPKIHIVKFTRESVTIKNTITLDHSISGYYANAQYDPLNGIMYTIGYTEDSWRLDEHGTNRMIIAKWSYNSGTPIFIDSFTVPFIQTTQGSFFYDGKIFVISSAESSTNTMIYVIDVTAKRVLSILKDFPSRVKTNETEGICLIDNLDEQYILIGTISSYTPYYEIRTN